MEKEYDIVYNKNFYVVMDNKLIKGKQDLSLQEAKILHLVITQIVKEDNDFKTFNCRISELADFLQIDSSNLYRDIRNICLSLLQRLVYIGTDNPKEPWEAFQWINSAKYDGHGNLQIRLSDDIKPYILELETYFTQYQLKNILSLNSFYAIRLYELLKTDEFKGDTFLEYSIQFLREFFDCENKYKRISNFKEKVINISKREINHSTDINISKIEYVKKGRSINSIRFYLAFPDYYKSRRHGALQKSNSN